MSAIRTPKGLIDLGPARGRVDGGPLTGAIDAGHDLPDRASEGSGPVEVVKHVHNPNTPWRKWRSINGGAQPAEALPLAPVRPCDDCGHVAVCRLTDLLPPPDGAPDALADGLRVRYLAVVECDHHAPTGAIVVRVADPPREVHEDRIASAHRGGQVMKERAEQRQRAAAASVASRVASGRAKVFSDDDLVASLRASGGDYAAAGRSHGVSGTAMRLRALRLIKHDRMPVDVRDMLEARARPRKAAAE